ncbi:MAG: hypothetical protein GAK31_00562 [Stenotrophomonas maltophilia]|uniref:DUF4440 domain-containing protein n=1 Tax=Stenotrophomonas maltophilia TaxID=40324 RepID=A0A7V8FJN4_STEMA|nr:MAG: hypothetical protein GAK31_00562 [Stenotrophomonas maltophilia]
MILPDRIDSVHEERLAALEQALQQALCSADTARVDGLLSPALFVLGMQGERMAALPWLSAWRDGRLSVQHLQLGDSETLHCGALALRSSRVVLHYQLHGQAAAPLHMRLLRVWVRSAGSEGAQLLSMHVMPA